MGALFFPNKSVYNFSEAKRFKLKYEGSAEMHEAKGKRDSLPGRGIAEMKENLYDEFEQLKACPSG